jgi:hypothetical protein
MHFFMVEIMSKDQSVKVLYLLKPGIKFTFGVQVTNKPEAWH